MARSAAKSGAPKKCGAAELLFEEVTELGVKRFGLRLPVTIVKY